MKPLTELTPEAFRSLRTDVFTIQKDAADTLGVARSTLNRWEQGKMPIPRWAQDLLRAWRTTGVPHRE